ncbi:hypothetical protein [Agromyces sp. NPDC058104]|uniref:hypothetical protein n=1 Tax=Agromyces sp. NPDC058104 TaxID=3346342 RepID=UPI0036DA8127
MNTPSESAGSIADSIAVGRARGYYRVLFDAGPVDAETFAELAGVPEPSGRVWLEEQAGAGLLRVVRAPEGDRDELLLPGEYVPVLVNAADTREFSGARALLREHLVEVERVRALAAGAQPSLAR